MDKSTIIYSEATKEFKQIKNNRRARLFVGILESCAIVFFTLVVLLFNNLSNTQVILISIFIIFILFFYPIRTIVSAHYISELKIYTDGISLPIKNLDDVFLLRERFIRFEDIEMVCFDIMKIPRKYYTTFDKYTTRDKIRLGKKNMKKWEQNSINIVKFETIPYILKTDNQTSIVFIRKNHEIIRLLGVYIGNREKIIESLRGKVTIIE